MTDKTVLTGEGDTTAPGGEGGEQPGQGGAAATPEGGEQPGKGGSQEAGAEGGAETAGAGSEEDEGKGGKAGEGEGEPEATGAPETYEDFSVPDGIELRSKDVQAFTEIAREFDLNQEQAQRLIDLESERMTELQQEQEQAQEEAWQSQVEQWAEETRTDEEVGGDKLDAATGTAKRVLDKFGTPELKKVLKQTGTGNHPEFVRVFARIGKVLSEDQLVTGGAEGAKDTSVAGRLYPESREAG